MSDLREDLQHVFKYLFLLLLCCIGLVLVFYFIFQLIHWLAVR